MNRRAAPVSDASPASTTARPPLPSIQVEEEEDDDNEATGQGHEPVDASTTGASFPARSRPTLKSNILSPSQSKSKSRSRSRSRSRSPQRLVHRFEPRAYDLRSHLSLFDSDKGKQVVKLFYTLQLVDGGYKPETREQSIKIQLHDIGFQRGSLLRGSEPEPGQDGKAVAEESNGGPSDPHQPSESKQGFFQSAQMIQINTESPANLPALDVSGSAVAAYDATDVTYTNGYPLRPAPNLVQSSSHSKTKGYQLSLAPSFPTLSNPLPVVGSAKYASDSVTAHSASLNYALRPYYIEPNYFQVLFPPSLLGLVNDNENYWQAPGSDPKSASSGVGLELTYWDRPQTCPEWLTIEASQILYLKRKRAHGFFHSAPCFAADAEALMPDSWMYPVSKYIRLRHRLLVKIKTSSLFLADEAREGDDPPSRPDATDEPEERPYLSLAFDLSHAPRHTKWTDTQTLDHGNYLQTASVELLTPFNPS